MKNGWLKLAVLSLAGIVVSVLALGIVSSIGGSNNMNMSSMNMGQTTTQGHSGQQSMDANTMVPSQGMQYNQNSMTNGMIGNNSMNPYNNMNNQQVMRQQLEQMKLRLMQMQQYMLYMNNMNGNANNNMNNMNGNTNNNMNSNTNNNMNNNNMGNSNNSNSGSSGMSSGMPMM